MATDFFERQDEAYRNSRKLVVLMILAVIGIILSVHVGVVLLIWFNADDVQLVSEMGLWGLLLQREMLLGVTGVVTAVVVAGSLYKLHTLKGGGGKIALRLGGRRLDPGTHDPDERKILNVVEEMAIASGVPVPPVYLLEGEESINAFAAGYEPGDAAIGVTRGAIRLLDREELQGVMAHEFSHILNGDMRLNIRLIGVVHGILLMGLIGRALMRPGRRRRRGKDENSAAAIGFVLFVVGYIGTFFGNMIKAAISREREFLADASSVQFTRNPGGITGALKKLGGLSQGSRIEHPRAAELSHMYFGSGVVQRLGSAFSTHPPLKERIERLDPTFEGTFEPVAFPESSAARLDEAAGFAGETPARAGQAGGPPPPSAEVGPEPAPRGPAPRPPDPVGPGAGDLAGAPEAAVVSLDDALARIGEPTPEHLAYVRALMSRVPEALKEAARDTKGARALVLSLLLDSDPEVLAKQHAILEERSSEGVRSRITVLAPDLEEMDVNARLPLLELAVATLKGLEETEFRAFRQTLEALTRADERMELFEWVAGSLVLHHLDPGLADGGRGRYTNLRGVSESVVILLSALAHAGSRAEAEVDAAFRAGIESLKDLGTLGHLPRAACGPRALDAALDELSRLVPKLKRDILEASARAIAADRVVTTEEGELFRVVAEWLGCPVPPLMPGQKVA